MPYGDAASRSWPPLDTTLAVIFLTLVALGPVMLLSASYVHADFYYGDPRLLFDQQMRNLAAGLAAAAVLWRVPYQVWLKWWWLVAILGLVSLLLIFVPFMSKSVKGSGRWLRLGFVDVQPSETIKLALAVVLARHFARAGERVRGFVRGALLPIAVVALYGGLIAFQKDLGGPLVVLAVVFGMTLAAGARWRHLACFGVFAVPVWFMITFYKHRMERIVGWADPWAVPHGEGFPIIHSFYGFGTGGTTGAGLGEGLQKQFFIPEIHTDYVFTVIGEELGLAGVAGTCLLFLILACRGLAIARAARTVGGSSLATGATLSIVIPAVINMMVALSIIPAKGLPLPFVSYGGTSLMVSCAAVGVLLNVSGQTLAAPARGPASPIAGARNGPVPIASVASASGGAGPAANDRGGR